MHRHECFNHCAGKSQLASDVVGAITKPIGDQIMGDQKVINDVVG